MVIFPLDEQKPSLITLMVILAMSSLGFAILGFVIGPEGTRDLGSGHQVELIRPEMPKLGELGEYWTAAGYLTVQREQDYSVQTSSAQGSEVWVQGQEKLVLVPSRHDLSLSEAILQLTSGFLEQGWMIQLEAVEHGYILGFWGSLPGLEQRVLAYKWQVELVNPRNYDYYFGGLISVMGEPFDPEGFRKGTPESPVLAVIIDDWGYITLAAEALTAYPLPLTMAVLPHLADSPEVSERIHAAGHELILHQPMEALDGSLELGPGGITAEMDADEVKAQLKENLASLPLVAGLNNHMGSLITSDPTVMTYVLEVVKELGLFFVDSRTSTSSVVPEVARQVGVPYGVNNLFIDNESDVEKIKAQVRAGLDLAQKQGHAVIIGHVRPATSRALWEMIPELIDSGVQLVPISRLLHVE
ncbi:MAG: divergent polysaccharide deacetylase family protein [Firmicutes bacterium]|nr:divergent polysaccharide deacetylase family protein [Bacillota bacterium]